MNCETFETLMADALGGELLPADERRFDEHLASCEACRKLYAVHRGTLDILRSLPEPRRVRVERIGERLILHDPNAASGRRRVRRSARWWLPSGIVRYAASLLIAFTAGYALHVGLMMRDAVRLPTAPGTVAVSEGETVQRALVEAYQQSPRRTDLARYMAALTGPGRERSTSE